MKNHHRSMCEGSTKYARRYHDVFTCYGGATVHDSKMTREKTQTPQMGNLAAAHLWWG